ncbi:MAG: FAD-dependent oxidoreductase [Nitrososphaerota archaeon]
MTTADALKPDVIVVGAGPAGLSAAYTLANNGLKVVVLERGRTPGSKNLYGGRVYSAPLEEIYPNFRNEAPIERWVKKERISLMSKGELFTLEYNSNDSTSFTAYLSKLTGWMAQKAEQAGAIVVTDVRVDGFFMEDGVVKGVRSGDDVLRSDVVVDAEGINRLLLERAGITRKLAARQVALGLKQVIKLDSQKIDERLGISSNDGLAWMLIGEPTGYLPGGAFLYTNSSTISLGLVIFLDAAISRIDQHVYELLEGLRLSPVMMNIIGDGTLLEYGAHLTPEAGLSLCPNKLYSDGLLIAGDAAGLLLNLGYTIRGVDFAAYSGYLAAKAVIKAHENGDYSSMTLSYYQKLIEESFIMKEMKKHSDVSKLFGSNELFSLYPSLVIDTAKRLYEIEEYSPKLMEAFRESIRGKSSMISILFKLLKLVRTI